MFLALRTAQARLMLDHDAAAIRRGAAELLWDTALRIEDGRATLAQRDLRDAMQALQDALARNAPDAEIDQLMSELQQAIDRYLQALAAEHAAHGPAEQQNLPPIDPSRMLSRRICSTCSTGRASWRAPARSDAARRCSRSCRRCWRICAGRAGQQQMRRNGQAGSRCARCRI